MSPVVDAVVDGLREPAYTGTNRCWPCTVVNVAIALALAGAIAIAWVPIAGVAALLVALGAIGVRGYLVPGTPTLTKRYAPPVFLRAFGKEPGIADTNGQGPDRDIEGALRDAGVIAPCPDVDDLCLDADFRSEWFEHVENVRTRENHQRDRLGRLLDVDPETIEYSQYDDAFVMLVDGHRVGRWESAAAFYADVAGAAVLPNYVAGWDALDAGRRAALLGSLRLFLDVCPACGGSVRMTEDVVASCCREYEVVAVECSACGDRLLEIDAVGNA